MTGAFDIIDYEPTINIFRQLSLKDKLSVSVACCKGWRSLRHEHSQEGRHSIIRGTLYASSRIPNNTCIFA